MKYQLLAAFDTEAAARELQSHAPLWDAFTLRQSLPGSAHYETKCIPLRGNLSFPFALDITRTRTPYADLLPECMSLANKLLAGLPVLEVGNVLLASLRAGGRIVPHEDEGPYAEYFTRIHIVIDSEPGNLFIVGGETHAPRNGDVFIFNHHLTHTAENHSDKERVHMIVDVKLKE